LRGLPVLEFAVTLLDARRCDVRRTDDVVHPPEPL
jgi:hypothetical protein